MITLWGRLNSVNVQKVVFCLEEIGAPYERVEAGLQFGVVDTPAYRAMNPNGLVPTLRDGDLVLWESNAILRYLCAVHGQGRFWPDAAARALGDRWMDWQQTAFAPAMFRAFHDLVRKPPEQRDAAAIEDSRKATEKRLAVLDAALAKTPWLGGETFGAAEFAVAPHVHRWLNMPVARLSHSALEKWYERVMTRPAAQRALTLPVT
ncbi:MAG: glutathione S-transferase family protein [Rhizobiales bacterium]|nr:glutathione S-transferase family protein [Hyphomicrobiales bacterium]